MTTENMNLLQLVNYLFSPQFYLDAKLAKEQNRLTIKWDKGLNKDCLRYYIDNKWTGVTIRKIIAIPMEYPKWFKLKSPIYRVSFSPQNSSYKCRDIVEAPTLKTAKEIAESYYKEWL